MCVYVSKGGGGLHGNPSTTPYNIHIIIMCWVCMCVHILMQMLVYVCD